jgi:hypothetical protein
MGGHARMACTDHGKETGMANATITYTPPDRAAVAKRARVLAARRAVISPVTDTEKIMSHIDERMHHVDTGRRADMLVSLPAMLAALVPMLAPLLICYGVALGIQCFLVTPVVVKIVRKL